MGPSLRQGRGWASARPESRRGGLRLLGQGSEQRVNAMRASLNRASVRPVSDETIREDTNLSPTRAATTEQKW